ncbi:MAG: hypothetical protein DRN30_00905 [Thermoplasmata archaeon]|nr:MAG: hypothetical protein DRN30_00905 [Thermoplasmata archaeon]
MLRAKKDKIEKILVGIGPKNLEIAISIANLLGKKNISMSEFVSYGKSYMLGKKVRIQEANSYNRNETKFFCPECNSPINVIRITTLKGKQNKRGWKSLIQCVNCTYESYSKMEAQKKIKQLIRLSRRKTNGNSK